MKSDHDLALKGEHVEEWIDVRFYRPLGMRVARALLPTRVSADRVSLWGLLVGFLAAHLFVYGDRRLDALGLLLIVVAEVLDSADGQLARLRGTASRSGRILDGYVDNLRWISVYVHLAIRLVGARAPSTAPGAVVLAVALAGVSHALQASTVDFVQGAYLRAEGKPVLDLPEDLDHVTLTRRWWNAVACRYYRDYVRRQARMFPCTIAVLRRLRAGGAASPLRAAYLVQQRRFLAPCGLIGQNAHVLVLGAGLLLGLPAALLWADLTAMNLACAAIVIGHERRAGALLRDPALTL